MLTPLMETADPSGRDVVTYSGLEEVRVGISEPYGRERREVDEREIGAKWRRRCGRDGCPKASKAESGGVKIVRLEVKLVMESAMR